MKRLMAITLAQGVDLSTMNGRSVPLFLL